MKLNKNKSFLAIRQHSH